MKQKIDDKNIAQIVKYLSNEMNTSEKEQFNLWLAASESHMKELERAQKIWDIASTEYHDDSITDKAWKNLHRRIHKADYSGFMHNRHFIKLNLKVAATVLILTGLGLTLFYLVHLQYAYKEITTLTDKILKPVILPDGTKVFLNSGTKIKFPATFDYGRKVELSGEAFFNVTHNEKSPFVIQTLNTQIVVVGTSFNVSANKDSVEVVVESGIVQVTSRKLKKEISLAKGNSGKYIANTNQLVKSAEADINSYAWKTNVITFNNVDLNYVSKTLNKLFHKPIYFENDRLKLLKLNATYKDLDLEGIFRALKATHCLNIKDKDGGYQISGPGCN